MKRTVLYEFRIVLAAHRGDNMFPRQIFSNHLNMRFYLRVALDNIINLVDFVCTKRWESLFDLDDLRSVGTLFWNLSI